jgi:hypothetical protein
VAFRFTVDIVFLLVAKKTANTSSVPIALGQNGTVKLVGPPVPECSNCREPRGGGTFSDDGDVYLCPKCLAFHAEYHRIMAIIDRDMKALSDEETHVHGDENGANMIQTAGSGATRSAIGGTLGRHG